MNNTKLVKTGIGLAALAAAGTYLLSGKRGAKNRRMVSDWADQLKDRAVKVKAKISHMAPAAAASGKHSK